MDTRVRYLVSDHDNPNMEEQSFLPEPSHRPEPTTPTPNILILNSQNGTRNSLRPKYVFLKEEYCFGEVKTRREAAAGEDKFR